MNDSWFVYILQCSDGTYYTGITKDLDRRVAMHNKGVAAKYTRSRTPVRILYSEGNFNRIEAMARERAIKSMPRDKKKKLTES